MGNTRTMPSFYSKKAFSVSWSASQFNPSDPGKGMVKLLGDSNNIYTSKINQLGLNQLFMADHFC
jgi:hypothetical protein